jgi:hypothetical protein
MLKLLKPSESCFHSLPFGLPSNRTSWSTMILVNAGTANIPPLFPQKSFGFPRIQAMRDTEKVHEADARARGNDSAFTQDLDAGIRIERQSHTRSHD